MTTVGAYEAKTHLPRLLDRVARGESIIITKHGVPVAVLAPPPALERPDPAAAIEAWRAFRTSIKLGRGMTIRQMVEQGRR